MTGWDGVVFDLDGTLLDTLGDIADAFNAVLARRGFPTHPADAYRRMVGEGVVRLAEAALPPARREPLLARALADEYRDECRRRGDPTARPYEGIPEILDAFAARAVPLAVVSNKPQEFVERCVRGKLGAWHFAHVAGSDGGAGRKPDPAAALEAARRVGAEPRKVLFVGDTGVDMRTAVAAGMFPAGALWGFRDAAELTAAGALALLAHPRDALGLQPAQ